MHAMRSQIGTLICRRGEQGRDMARTLLGTMLCCVFADCHQVLSFQLDHDQLPQLEEGCHDEPEEDCGYGLLRPDPLPFGVCCG